MYYSARLNPVLVFIGLAYNRQLSYLGITCTCHNSTEGLGWAGVGSSLMAWTACVEHSRMTVHILGWWTVGIESHRWISPHCWSIRASDGPGFYSAFVRPGWSMMVTLFLLELPSECQASVGLLFCQPLSGRCWWDYLYFVGWLFIIYLICACLKINGVLMVFWWFGHLNCINSQWLPRWIGKLSYRLIGCCLLKITLIIVRRVTEHLERLGEWNTTFVLSFRLAPLLHRNSLILPVHIWILECWILFSGVVEGS